MNYDKEAFNKLIKRFYLRDYQNLINNEEYIEKLYINSLTEYKLSQQKLKVNSNLQKYYYLKLWN